MSINIYISMRIDGLRHALSAQSLARKASYVGPKSGIQGLKTSLIEVFFHNNTQPVALVQRLLWLCMICAYLMSRQKNEAEERGRNGIFFRGSVPIGQKIIITANGRLYPQGLCQSTKAHVPELRPGRTQAGVTFCR